MRGPDRARPGVVVSRILVVGNGPAAHRLADRLHRRGHRGSVTVLGAEPVAAYNRLLLPAVLSGALPPDVVELPAPPPGTEVRTGVTAVAVDRRRRRVLADDGRSHPYEQLVLATGARARVPETAGLRRPDGRLRPDVRVVRQLSDCFPPPDGPVVVLGAGPLGVEVAVAARGRGPVTLVHRGPHPMNRHLDPAAGAALTRHLEAAGVEVLTGRRAVEWRPGELRLADGGRLAARTLLLCTGVEPDTGLARRAGLTVRTGVVVDAQLRTSDPRIHAVGDCAEHDGVVAGRLTDAWEQADTLAAVLTGESVRHRPGRPVTRLRAGTVDVVALGPPGHTGGHTVRLTDPARGRYARLSLRDDRVAAATVVGLPHAVATLTQLHDGDMPLPAGRLGVLLGAEFRAEEDFEMPDDAVICLCNNVTKRVLLAARDAGARDLPALVAATRVASGCGRCADLVCRVCEVQP